MARKLTPSYTDDASNVEGVTIAQTTGEDGKQSDAEAGASLSASQRVAITMTQGDSVYLMDTSQSNPLAAYVRRVGIKQAKRGRKAS